jgi:hypothetical protein
MTKERPRRLVFVKTADLELWRCRPVGAVQVLDLKDRRIGRIDGLILDAHHDRPLFIVVGRDDLRPKRFLVPVGDAWFDETARAVRVDVRPGGHDAPAFDAGAFDRMSDVEAADFERRVLAQCCPEVGVHRDGTVDYGRLEAFRCPSWLR